MTGSPWARRVLKGNVYLEKSAVEIEHLKSNIVFYNSLNKKKEHFQPLNPPVVTFYSCGPTVYDYAHIGNFRAFLIYDLIKRWLQYVGYSVEHICNLTDVDDKIILKMAREGKSLQEITSFYTNTFFQDLKTLNIIPATKYPKATEFIPQMVSMIDNLLEKNIAYTVNGSVYYNVEAFQPKYRVLTDHLNDNALQSSVGRGSLDKRNSRDFALWKAHTPADGNVAWEASFGKGRPGTASAHNFW
jgi:cysteinyl-tRNA synthetase